MVKDLTNKYYEGGLDSRYVNCLSAPSKRQPKATKPTMVEMIPMRDGVCLYTEIFLSSSSFDNTSESFPAIFSRTPYPYSRPSRLDKRPISSYLEAGYAVVWQNTRGQGSSSGDFHFLKDDMYDGYDSIAWIAEQPWCDGSVGMEGSSYAGSTQLLAAKAKPPALKCIMPTAFVGNFTHCFPFSYGVPSKGPLMQWYQLADSETGDDMDVCYGDMRGLNHPRWGPAFRKRPLIEAADNILSGDKIDSYRDTIANPKDNGYWHSIHFTDNELADLDLPIFFTDGWYDMTVGPIDFFSRLEKSRPSDNRYLLVGPWDHYQTAAHSQPGDDNGDRILPDNGAFNHVDLRLAFFDRYLKGNKKALAHKERVHVYITGSPDSNANCWRGFETFPAPSTEYKLLYLHSRGDARSFPGDGCLSWQEPTDETADSYTYDPTLPTQSQVENSQDRRDVEVRSDVLTYTSQPLTAPLTILGDIKLILHAASDGPDTDWFALITEVFPDGQSKSFHYAPPAFRARYREGFDKEVFLTPNKPEEFTISMGPAGHQIAVGNRLRLSIFSAAFPEYEPNTNTGNEAATDITMRVAQQTIFHDSERPSRIELPVIDL